MKLPFSNPQKRVWQNPMAPDVCRLQYPAEGVRGLSSAAAKRSAFTMIEIALCLAIVGFALVAIIGVLPAGLNVQKENREETIINQDATVWVDAIRAGGSGPNAIGAYDELTNYVDRIVVDWFAYVVTPTTTNLGSQGSILGQQIPAPGVDVLITNGARIVGLLSTPQIYRIPNGGGSFVSNYVSAYVRAISGSATEKAPQDNPDVRDLAFGYRLVVDFSPLGSADLAGIQTNAMDHVVRDNLADLRLLFRWPLKRPFDPNLADPPAGNGRLVFRTELGGNIALRADRGVPFYFLQPRDYRP